MDVLLESLKLATALVALAAAIVKLLSEASGSDDRRNNKEGR